MRIDDKLCKYNIGKLYKRNGIDCYLDRYRKILVPANPEEKVRQQIGRYLEVELNIPKNMIDTEVHLRHYGINSRKRIDITIDERRDDGELYTIALVECKASYVKLTNNVYNQAKEYADILGVNYVFITNGIDMYAFYYNEDKEQYYNLKNIPKYEEIVSNKIDEKEYENDWKYERLEFEELKDIELLHENDYFYMLGEDTPDKLKSFIINLGECFLDSSKIFPTKSYNYFKVIEDYGIRYMHYGNASGGSYDTMYRTLVIEDKHGNNQMISFCIISCMKFENDPAHRNSTGKSVLVVAVDDFDKSHNSLQLNLNKELKVVGNKVIISHNGAITIGNMGAGKREELKKFVKKECPELLNEKQEIILGEISNDKLLCMDQEDIEVLVVNLIKYALVRDEYREYVKKIKKHKNK